MALTGVMPNHVKKFIRFLYFGVDKSALSFIIQKSSGVWLSLVERLVRGPRGRRFKSSHSDQRQRPRKPSHKYLWLGLFLFTCILPKK